MQSLPTPRPRPRFHLLLSLEAETKRSNSGTHVPQRISSCCRCLRAAVCPLAAFFPALICCALSPSCDFVSEQTLLLPASVGSLAWAGPGSGVVACGLEDGSIHLLQVCSGQICAARFASSSAHVAAVCVAASSIRLVGCRAFVFSDAPPSPSSVLLPLHSLPSTGACLERLLFVFPHRRPVFSRWRWRGQCRVAAAAARFGRGRPLRAHAQRRAAVVIARLPFPWICRCGAGA